MRYDATQAHWPPDMASDSVEYGSGTFGYQDKRLPAEESIREPIGIDEELAEAAGSDLASESATDLGFFLSWAGRFALLSANREKELASTLWLARQRLQRAIQAASVWRGGPPPKIPSQPHYRAQPLSPTARRRGIASEEYAERLLRVFEGGHYQGEGFDRSLSVPLPSPPKPRRGRRHIGARLPVLTRRQVRAIAPILREELEKTRAAREELVQHNLRLVIWVAKTYRGRGLDLVDLVQEGCMGLLRAIDRFDPAVGTRFSTFATHWVRQGIGRALAEKARVIRIPLNRLPEVRDVTKAQSRLTQRLNRPPSLEDIAVETKSDQQKVQEVLRALAPLTSIDAPLPSGELSHADLLSDESAPSPLDRAIEEETIQSVRKRLAEMPERHRIILAMRYGIGYPTECTLDQIGVALGLSRERIRQIEKAAREEFQKEWVAEARG